MQQQQKFGEVDKCYHFSMKNKILKLEDLFKKVDTESVDVSYVDYWTKIDPGFLQDYIENYGLRTKTKTNVK